MFNITVQSSNLGNLRSAMAKMGVGVAIESTFIDNGVRILDVAIGDCEDKYSKRVAKAAERYQY